ncbi:MAG: hypothetical protein HGA54_02785 [Actinobacteria bacterium]|nr:hypothetical protein [Actinomycetota bacterium]
MVLKKITSFLLAVFQVVFMAVALVYFTAFLLSFFTLTLRVPLATTFVEQLLAFTPAIFSVFPTVDSPIGGYCHFDFAAIFVIAIVLEWLTARWRKDIRSDIKRSKH